MQSLTAMERKKAGNYSAKKLEKMLDEVFCIFSDFKEDCLPASITIHTSNKRLAMGFFYR
ncbi:MAG: hypothetical protein KZQ66_10385 [Candidatus Thiodiazotropha sp. (ex Lucinoma aequizonata)]|nr:hypothetical protein [Candidatus Thiodiazotropha sp. (ex Lucinoma aequizonata)]MCU7897935.1 hypothetical protein [Candidatus Thiodiazotropha sp. (ex Lucinoma aequizonata)]MCU7902342.1 hypothetical protein [Candidatus Thiodiazotropha sp. (ex Lucinoma aequizonata)]